MSTAAGAVYKPNIELSHSRILDLYFVITINNFNIVKASVSQVLQAHVPRTPGRMRQVRQDPSREQLEGDHFIYISSIFFLQIYELKTV